MEDARISIRDIKMIQTPVSDALASGSALQFVTKVIQGRDGVISVSKSNIKTVSDSNNGLMTIA